MFSDKRIVPALCYVMSIVTFLGGVWICVLVFQATTTSGLIKQWMWLYTATIAGIIFSDVLIATTLSCYLKKAEYWLGR